MQNSEGSEETLTTNSWSRRPDESNEAYGYFLAYLEMLPRDYRVLAERQGRAYNTIKHYATIYRWKERTLAWDEAQFTERSINRRETIALLQDSVVKDEVTDAKAMLEVWRKRLTQLSGDLSAGDMLKMVQARKQIDNLLRLAAEMPSAYNPVPSQPTDEDGEYILTADGKPNASSSTKPARLPAENQQPPGEIQGIELWSEMGEEFLSEE